MITAALIGASSDDVNWREIFIFLGVTGILLAIIVKLVIREPVRGAMEFNDQREIEKPPFIESLKTLLRIPAWWAMCFGIAFGSFVSYSNLPFILNILVTLDPSFDFQTLVIILGIINGITYAGGAFFGARLADKWGKKDIRAYGWLPAISITLCLPIGIAAWWSSTVEMNLIFTSLFLVFMGIYLGPSFAIAQTLAPIHMRAMSTALFFFILKYDWLGAGPSISGWMIDLFKEYGEVESIRYAMTVTSLYLFHPLSVFMVVAKKLPKDWEGG